MLVTSCDAYSDVEGPFVRLFRKNWPDCPFQLVLLTETKTGHGFDRIIKAGAGKSWSRMLFDALSVIETPYVLMLMNDYYVDSKVDTKLILRRLEDAKRADALNYRLCPEPPRAVKNTAYSISCKAGIWNREFLRDLAFKTGSAWEFERHGSFMFDENDKRPLMVSEKQEFPFLDAVHKGYWEPAAVKLLADEGIDVDYTVRGAAPMAVRAKELVKSLVFRVNPNLVTMIQNGLTPRKT